MTSMVWVKAQSLPRTGFSLSSGSEVIVTRIRTHSVCKLDWDSVYDLDKISSYVQVRIQHVTNHV